MATLFITGCSSKTSSEIIVGPDDSEPSSVLPNTDISSSGEGTTASIPSTDTGTSNSETSGGDTSTSDTSLEQPGDVLSTIKDVKEAALKLTMPSTQPHVVEDKTQTYKIQGHVLENLTSGTTKTGYTPDGKTVLIDSTDWILCSSYSSTANSLYQKVSSYLDKDTTQYEVTGHLALSFGVPELVVDSFTWNQNLNIDYSVTPTKTFNDLSSYYEDTYNLEYNIKGNGVGEMVKLNNLTCIGRADNASTGKWTFIDKDNHYLDVLYNINHNAFTPGTVYNLVGLQNTYHYNCSFRAMRHEISSENKTELDTSKSVSTTISNLFNNYSFKDDSYNKVSKAYFNNKMNIYKVNAYVNHYESSGKWYITLSDNDYSPTSQNDAYSHYQIPINNDGYWNTTEYSFSYKNLYSYEDVGSPIDVYISLYQENHVSVDPIKNKAVWKVYLYEELVPEFIN